jgi:succinate dehydrogenase / fumarate reductase iron-sulfur subunit
MTTNTSTPLRLKLKVWRQSDASRKGGLVDYAMDDVSPEMSFLEMMDVLNQKLIKRGEEPVAFEHDCREGICGSCSMVINGAPHGPETATTTCQLHMRKFRDGDTLVVEPFRARSLPVIKDLVVDRRALDRIIARGGFISANTGNAPEANATRIPKPDADAAMDAAQCIGCGACAAACPNGSINLFVAAKISHLAKLPQGAAERSQRALDMVTQAEEEGFGGCTNIGACSSACPKEISLETIARMNRDFLKASVTTREDSVTNVRLFAFE